MTRHEQDYVQPIPVTERNLVSDEYDSQAAAREVGIEIGIAALTLRENDGLTYQIDKRMIELTFAAGDSIMGETATELREAKTKAGQNCLKAKSIGNKLRSSIDARASLVQGAAFTTERAVNSRLKTELADIAGHVQEVTSTATERIAELEAEAEEKIRLIREQLHRDTTEIATKRDGALDQLSTRQGVTESWADANKTALIGNRDQALTLFDERAAEIDRLVAQQIAINEATLADIDTLGQKLNEDRAELDRLRLRASELYDNYTLRMRDKLAIDERVDQSGKALDVVRREIHETGIALDQTVQYIGQLELDYQEALAVVRARYAGNPTLAAALQHKDAHVAQLMMDKRRYASHATSLNNRLAELANVEQARIQNRRPLLSEQGIALAAVSASERSVQDAYRMMLRLKQSIAEECSQLILATKAWMDKPVEIDVDTDDVTAVDDDSVIELLTKGMTLDDDLHTIDVPEEEVVELAEHPAQQQPQPDVWKNNFGIPLIARVVQAAPSPGVIRTKDGTEVSFTCEAVS